MYITRKTRLAFCQSAILLFLLVFSSSLFAVDHPHIIVTTSEYEMLRNRAVDWPWSVIKNKAIDYATGASFNSSASYESRCKTVHNIASACALAYILDEPNRPRYINKLESLLPDAIHRIRVEKGNKDDHEFNVSPAHAAFMLYIAMDIMYHGLNDSLRRAMENDCDFIADNHVSDWNASEYAIKGLKELYYNGNTPLFSGWVDKYFKRIDDLTSKDGVYATGPGYTKSRLFMDDRMQKKIFMDICEYQGYPLFYKNPKFVNLHEYIMGYTMTPFNRAFTFGDSPPTKDLDEWSVAALRARRFSKKAQQFAAWRVGPLTDASVEGGLLHYILCDTLPQEPVRPASRIFTKGGAWFYENSDSKRALSAALWNNYAEDVSHAHYDVNAIHVAGYGAHLLRNSGYDGYGKPDPATWEWIRRTAESSNTVTVGGRNHSSVFGRGIEDGLVGGEIEWASGNAGGAIATARHLRNLIFVHPDPGFANGYFLVLDEICTVFSWEAEAPVNVFWHPNSSKSPVIADSSLFSWKIEGCDYGGDEAGVHLYLVTRPLSWQIKEGYLASYSSCSRFTGKYLDAAYKCQQNNAQILTVIFPTDRTHSAPSFESLAVDSADVCLINHGNNVNDFAVRSNGEASVRIGKADMSGIGLLWREEAENLEKFLALKTRRFVWGDEQRIGFESSAPISLYMKGEEGQCSSQCTEVTFYKKNISSILIDGMSRPLLEKNETSATVEIEAGVHSLRIETEPSTYVDQKKAGQEVIFRLEQNYPNPFNNSTVILFSLPEGEHVRLAIYNVAGQLVKVLMNDFIPAGSHRLTWQADGLARGIYIARLEAGQYTRSIKLILQ